MIYSVPMHTADADVSVEASVFFYADVVGSIVTCSSGGALPGSIREAVLALLGRTSRPERQPSLPPFAGRLCRSKSATDSRTPSAPFAYARDSRTLKEERYARL